MQVIFGCEFGDKYYVNAVYYYGCSGSALEGVVVKPVSLLRGVIL
jgi:hypothetical protein